MLYLFDAALGFIPNENASGYNSGNMETQLKMQFNINLSN